MPSRFDRIQCLASRLANVVLFSGHENEMVSSRAHREGWKLERWINAVFWWEPEHCKRSYEWEVSRAEIILAANAGR